jgi:hypothetical protein
MSILIATLVCFGFDFRLSAGESLRRNTGLSRSMEMYLFPVGVSTSNHLSDSETNRYGPLESDCNDFLKASFYSKKCLDVSTSKNVHR